MTGDDGASILLPWKASGAIVSHSGGDLLAEQALQGPREGQLHVSGKTEMTLLEGQEDPFVLEQVEGRRQIPKRRQDIEHVPSHPAQLAIELFGIVEVLHRV